VGVEGKDKAKVLEAGAAVLVQQLGAPSPSSRNDYGLSLDPISPRNRASPNRIISQIERNETIPTLTTIWRLAHAPRRFDRIVLHGGGGGPFVRAYRARGTPILLSDDGLCKLAVIGWLKTVDWLQWYDFQADTRRRARPRPQAHSRRRQSSASPCSRANSRSWSRSSARSSARAKTLALPAATARTASANLSSESAPRDDGFASSRPRRWIEAFGQAGLSRQLAVF